MTNGKNYLLKLDGDGDYIQVPSHKDLTIARDVNCSRIGMTLYAEIRPDVLDFPKTDGAGGPYVNFIGKNSPTKRGWNLRIYNKNSNTPNRIAGYLFSPEKSKGVASYFQEPLVAGQWIKIALVVDHDYVYIVKNGNLRDCKVYSDIYSANIKSGCDDDPNRPVDPQNRDQPMRIGTDYLSSFFKGAFREVRLYNKPLLSEIPNMINGTFTTTNLVFWHNYRLGNAIDQSGRGHNGTLFGNAHFELDTTVCPTLSCTISCPLSIVQGNVGKLSITTSGGVAPLAYLWSILKPDNKIDKYMVQNINYTYSQQGTYSTNCIVTDSCSTAKVFKKVCSTIVTAPPINVDKFGIIKIYQTVSNGREWYSKWDNSHPRSWENTKDPDDPEFITSNGTGIYNVDGTGIIKIGGNYPRMYITKADLTGYWHNVEITVYGQRKSDLGEDYGGLCPYARTNHFIDTNLCDTRGYGARLRYDGSIDIEKEIRHSGPYMHDVVPRIKLQYFKDTNNNPIRMPKNIWYGLKFVVYDLSTSNVKMEIYVDETDGLNGGTWNKIYEFTDDGTNFGVNCNYDGACIPCKPGIDSALMLTNSEIRPGSESGKPNLAVYFRTDAIGVDDLWFKKASIREIMI